MAERRNIPTTLAPLDSATMSSSNRQLVSKYYADHFSRNSKIALLDTPDTNFNGYKNWDANGSYPCVKI